MSFKKLAYTVLATIAGFGAGFIAGAAGGAQITGPVGAAFPEWGGAFILFMGAWGGISGAAGAWVATSGPKGEGGSSHAIVPEELSICAACIDARMQAALERHKKSGQVPSSEQSAIYAECAMIAYKATH